METIKKRFFPKMRDLKSYLFILTLVTDILWRLNILDILKVENTQRQL